MDIPTKFEEALERLAAEAILKMANSSEPGEVLREYLVQAYHLKRPIFVNSPGDGNDGE